MGEYDTAVGTPRGLAVCDSLCCGDDCVGVVVGRIFVDRVGIDNFVLWIFPGSGSGDFLGGGYGFVTG